jgi:hypothetical protein
VLERACEKESNRRERNMRVWSDIDPKPGCELRGAQVIEKYERAHHVPALKGQYAPHHEAAQVAFPRIDHL